MFDLDSKSFEVLCELRLDILYLNRPRVSWLKIIRIYCYYWLSVSLWDLSVMTTPGLHLWWSLYVEKASQIPLFGRNCKGHYIEVGRYREKPTTWRSLCNFNSLTSETDARGSLLRFDRINNSLVRSTQALTFFPAHFCQHSIAYIVIFDAMQRWLFRNDRRRSNYSFLSESTILTFLLKSNFQK